MVNPPITLEMIGSQEVMRRRWREPQGGGTTGDVRLSVRRPLGICPSARLQLSSETFSSFVVFLGCLLVCGWHLSNLENGAH